MGEPSCKLYLLFAAVSLVSAVSFLVAASLLVILKITL